MCAEGTRTMHACIGKRPGTICVLQGLACREEARNHMCAAGTRTMHVGKRPGTICVLQGLGPCM